VSFLLDIEESARYFAGGSELIALFQGKLSSWCHAAFVGNDGAISTHGYRADCAWCGVRHAI
jgi:hypothetical protein